MAKRGRKPRHAAAPEPVTPALTKEGLELLPCPFCGSLDVRLTSAAGERCPEPPYWVTCGRCCAFWPAPKIQDSDERAAELWNKRAGEAKLRAALLEVLRAALLEGLQ